MRRLQHARPEAAAVEWVELGRLGAPYGVRGWIHVDSHTDPPQRLLEYPEWTLQRANGERVIRRLTGGRTHGVHLVASLEGVSDREAAAALTGSAVQVQRDALPAPKANEYYRADLLGFEVRNLQGVSLGAVSHFVDAPTGALMVLRGTGAEHWVLANPRYLKRVDLAARRLLVDWPAELE